MSTTKVLCSSYLRSQTQALCDAAICMLDLELTAHQGSCAIHVQYLIAEVEAICAGFEVTCMKL
jgi:hypothetical protein